MAAGEKMRKEREKGENCIKNGIKSFKFATFWGFKLYIFLKQRTRRIFRWDKGVNFRNAQYIPLFGIRTTPL